MYFAAVAFEFARVSEGERVKAQVALRAAITAVDTRKMAIDWSPNSLYRVNEPTDPQSVYKTFRELDVRKLVRFEITRCNQSRRRTKCAELVFDRGLGDGGVTVLEVATATGNVRAPADVRALSMMQFIAPRD
ncbi:MAG: hypothetical protein JSR79_02530 [Proteobacteria bacterium]|nr:hypothetical protein [Pseudomonadota bacterium]